MKALRLDDISEDIVDKLKTGCILYLHSEHTRSSRTVSGSVSIGVHALKACCDRDVTANKYECQQSRQ